MSFFFRLHPVLYWIAAVAVIGLGVFSYFDTLQDNERRAAALADGAPAPVRLSEFDPAAHGNAAGEVTIIAAIEADAMYTLTEEKNGRETDRNWTAPLRTAIASGDRSVIRAAIFERGDDISNDQLAEWIIANSGYGPIVQLNGVLRTLTSKDREQVENAFAEQNLTLAEDAIFIDPFLLPREQELASRDPMTFPIVAGVVSVLLFLYGFFRRWMRRRAARRALVNA
ncbi:MAG: hypothetical protein AAF909_07890 [Pseudomonadota bacterium]